jgi:predicted nucleotidyltransferase component of viral defense system
MRISARHLSLMVGFGELRKLSQTWQIDIAAVERVYALDWLLKAISDQDYFKQVLALRGAAALSKAYFPDYPPIEEADFVTESNLDPVLLEAGLTGAAEEAAQNSGLRFKLHSIRGREARFEFTGPLGRRSAAQPRLQLRFQVGKLRADPVQFPMLHPFAERWEATVRSVSLEEITAGLVALIEGRPRARDVFDLWFIFEHGADRINRIVTRDLVAQLREKDGYPVRGDFDPDYRPFVAKAWDNALRDVGEKPTFIQAENEIQGRLGEILLRNL